MNKNQIQQGDVCIEFIKELPKGAKKIADRILRHGESGNVHELVGDVEVFEFEGQKYFAVGSDGATLQHGEHNALLLEPNRIGIITPGVLEYDYETEEAKRVVD